MAYQGLAQRRQVRIEIALKRMHDETVAVVFAALYQGDFDALDDPASQLVLQALCRSTESLDSAADPEQIARYLQQYDEEQLAHHMNNVRGIYHELWFTDATNLDGSAEIMASLFEATNYPGADVRMSHSNGDYQDVQLKATDSTAYIYSHLERYPDIDVYATNEVAARIEDVRVHSSGISNQQLEQDVSVVYDRLDAGLEQPLDAVPMATIWTLAWYLTPLVADYLKGHIDKQELIDRVIEQTGWPVARVVALLALMSFPATAPWAIAWVLAKTLWVFGKAFAEDFTDKHITHLRSQ